MTTSKEYFKSLSPRARQAWKESFEQNIAFAQNRLTRRNRNGGLITAGKMPWMLPHWKQGLADLMEVMEELDKSTVM